MEGKTNGSAAANEPRHYTELVLSLDISPTWHVHIGGNIENDDVALAVLHQAVRYFEAKLRAAAALELQAKYAEQARTAGIVNKVLGRG